MTVIDVGPGAGNKMGNSSYLATYVDMANPANATGIITAAQFWFNTNGSGLKVGTFYGTTLSWTYRAGATLGDITAGSTQTFTGLSFAVSTDDCIGGYWSSGLCGMVYFGGVNVPWNNGDHCTNEGAQAYSAEPDYGLSIYATGTTEIPSTASETRFITFGDLRTKRHRQIFRKNLKLK